MIRLIVKLQTNKSGATAIEYGLIAALVSVAAIGALSLMGEWGRRSTPCSPPYRASSIQPWRRCPRLKV